jgi:hypothetical protein
MQKANCSNKMVGRSSEQMYIYILLRLDELVATIELCDAAFVLLTHTVLSAYHWSSFFGRYRLFSSTLPPSVS